MRVFVNILITLIIYGAFVAPLWLIEPIKDCGHETVYSNAAWVYMQIFFVLVFGAFLSKINEYVRRITDRIHVNIYYQEINSDE